MRYTTMSEDRPPKNAQNEMAERARTVFPTPMSIATAAPNAAPLEMPSTYGSASGFRSRAWSPTPTAARQLPTMKPSSTLGSLTCSRITLEGPSESIPVSPLRSAPKRIRAKSTNPISSVPNRKDAIMTSRLAAASGNIVVTHLRLVNTDCSARGVTSVAATLVPTSPWGSAPSPLPSNLLWPPRNPIRV